MSETDDFLEHYGVVGMKWGKRSGGLKDRVKGAALDRNQRRLTGAFDVARVANKVNNHKITKTQAVVGVALGGLPAVGLAYSRPLIAKHANKKVSSLLAQKERIESGKTNVRDKMETFATLSSLDLVVSRRNKRGD